ncbi:Aspartate--tRNA ligase, mitochondrial [Holothuria leucospilota]|uniref:Aspartate--tRNA ligase, mitochondrial n=1 Tax=Holothuria leucospilota TaxID=206669 RepID=A0A9Q1C691_HOLLE|nr:Aspartate--tRNA ligase, mitochondrial [Holothuria leucospilota]
MMRSICRSYQTFLIICNSHIRRNGKRATSSVSWRTHNCGQLRASDAGSKVTLCGWLQYKRFDFMATLRDAYGVIQIVLPEDEVKRSLLSSKLSEANLESVIKVEGHVQRRPVAKINSQMPTGSVEIVAGELEIMNNCTETLPMQVHEHLNVTETTRMLFRYLDLRSSRMQRNLRLRSDVAMKIREYLWKKHGFVEVETPNLFRRTPGGAKEFVVPTHQKGLFYSLPQSPQQFKQLLMVGAIDRYFQIARCFRDEGSRPDRQPEFTQVDIEMSFVDKECIYNLMEGLVKYCWPEHLPDVITPFPRMSYQKALDEYGTDKPDTRFEMTLVDITAILQGCGIAIFESSPSSNFIIKAMTCPSGDKFLTKSTVDILQGNCKKLYNTNFLLVHVREKSWKSPISKHLSEKTKKKIMDTVGAKPGDLLFICAGPRETVNAALGFLRLQCAECLEEQGVRLRDPNSYKFLWVEDFPLFLKSEETNGGSDLESAHHPFTAPVVGEEHLVYSEPVKVKGQHYDLVLNGVEVAGGSIRIHHSDLQKYILEEVLKEDSSEMSHLLEALQSGCPPHGGIAMGFDRFVSLLCGERTIRDVIAFPKTSEGNDLMSGAPSSISQEDLDRYHITVPSGDSGS